jgi:hypothetical protein
LRLRRDFPGTRRDAIRADAIPLRQATTRRAPEDTNANRFTPAPLDRARVTGALEENRHTFHRGFDPLFPGSFHQFLEIFLITPAKAAGNDFVDLSSKFPALWGATCFRGRCGLMCARSEPEWVRAGRAFFAGIAQLVEQLICNYPVS